MKKLGELVLALAKQTGVDVKDKGLVAAIKAVEKVELPEEIVTTIQDSLFTMESALANPDIIGKLKAESLNAVDEKLFAMVEAFKLGDGFLHNLKETKGTYNRIESVQKAILDKNKVDLEAAKADPKADPKDKEKLEELNRKIVGLNADVLKAKEGTVSKEEHDTAIAKYEKQALNSLIGGLFSDTKFAMDQIPRETNILTATSLFSSKVAEKGLTLVNDNGTMKFKTKEDSPYYIDNKEVMPKMFADQLLTDNSLIKVNDPSPTPAPTPTPTPDASSDTSAAAAEQRQEMEDRHY